MPVYVIVKALPRMCMKNTALGACQEANTGQSKSKALFALRHPKCFCCIFCTNKHTWCFRCFIVVLLKVIFLSTQTTLIFSDQTISKLSVVIE